MTKTFVDKHTGIRVVVTDPRYFSYYVAQGWKELASGIDPNDLQGNCDHRKWDAATDACALCGKAWNTILWDSGSKPCCAGGLNSALPAQYSNGKWHSIDCDSLKPPLGLDPIVPQQIDYRPKTSRNRCECGGWATSNPNAHSFWCPEYKK